MMGECNKYDVLRDVWKCVVPSIRYMDVIAWNKIDKWGRIEKLGWH